MGQVFNEPKHEYSDQLRQAIPVPVPRSLRVPQAGTAHRRPRLTPVATARDSLPLHLR